MLRNKTRWIRFGLARCVGLLLVGGILSGCATMGASGLKNKLAAYRGDGQIVISQPHAGRSQQEGDQIAALVALGAFGPIVFDTDDLDAAFEKARATGLGEVLQEPMDQGWGVRDCAFRDPAGNMVRVGEKAA